MELTSGCIQNGIYSFEIGLFIQWLENLTMQTFDHAYSVRLFGGNVHQHYVFN